MIVSSDAATWSMPARSSPAVYCFHNSAFSASVLASERWRRGEWHQLREASNSSKRSISRAVILPSPSARRRNIIIGSSTTTLDFSVRRTGMFESLLSGSGADLSYGRSRREHRSGACTEEIVGNDAENGASGVQIAAEKVVNHLARDSDDFGGRTDHFDRGGTRAAGNDADLAEHGTGLAAAKNDASLLALDPGLGLSAHQHEHRIGAFAEPADLVADSERGKG